MKIIDISMAIHPEMPVYKGRAEKRPSHHFDKTIPPDSINESSITMNLHTGTHVDTPLHMMEDGWTMDDFPLEKLITPSLLIDLTHVEDGITREDLEHRGIKKDDFVLLKTQNSFGLANSPEFVYIKEDAANFLAELGVKGVGIDALGVERDQPGHKTHLALMNAGVVILEGLDLAEAPEGRHTLVLLPLKIKGAEGAPARAVLVEGLMTQ